MIGSLFSGIGGLELGLEWAGLGPVVWQVESDAFARSVLALHWPNASRAVEDVRHAGKANLAPVDIVCGGFPCQDISYAGDGAGLAGARSGLWFEYARIIEEIQPHIVVIENVAALVTRGLDRVIGDLERLGYRVTARIIKASDVGAPHRRERVFIVADARCERSERRRSRSELVGATGAREGQGAEWQRDGDTARDGGKTLAHGHGHGHGREGERGGGGAPTISDRHEGAGRSDARRGGEVADAVRARREGANGPDGASRESRTAVVAERCGDAGRDERSTQSGVGRGADGLPARMDRWPAGPGQAQHTWEPARVGTQKIDNRPARLRALGNAVVPHVAYEVGVYVRSLLDQHKRAL